MPQTLEQVRRRVARRCRLNVLAAQAGAVLGALALAAGAAVLAERLTGFRVIFAWTIASASSAAAAAMIALCVARWPGAMQVALLIDDRLGLRERVSTALALADRDDPFARAAERQTRQLAESLDAGGRFPVRLTRRWLAVSALWLTAVAIALFMPQFDPFRLQEQRRAERQRIDAMQQAHADVRQAVEPVKAVVRQIGQPALNEALAALDASPDAIEPNAVRRDAIRKLGDLAERLRQVQVDESTGSPDALRDVLRRLRAEGQSTRELSRSLSAGQLGKAAEQARELADKLQHGDLGEQDKQAVQRELGELSKRLNELAEKADEAPPPADGKQASDRKSACQSCRELAEQLGRCAGQEGQGPSAEELAALAGKLEQLEDAAAKGRQCEAGREAIDQAVRKLGQACREGNRDDPGDDRQAGLGGLEGSLEPGGPSRPTGDDVPAPTGPRATVPNPPTDAPPVASGFFRGEQVIGQSQRKLTETVQAARDRAAEAISQSRIPRKYESAVKHYFDQLDPSTRATRRPGDE